MTPPSPTTEDDTHPFPDEAVRRKAIAVGTFLVLMAISMFLVLLWANVFIGVSGAGWAAAIGTIAVMSGIAWTFLWIGAGR